MPSKIRNIRLKDIPQNVGDFTDKAAFAYFLRQTEKHERSQNITPEEREKQLKKIKVRTLSFSALYGALGVLFLYLPQYIRPDIFQTTDYTLPFIELKIKVSLFELFYGVALVAVEIWLLTLLDLKAVSKVAVLYGFPPDRFFENAEKEGEELLYIGLGKEHKKLSKIGINPFQRMSRAGVVLLLIFFRLKAFLSNFIFRIILKRLLGRLAVRAVVDLAGIPIYAFWNAYASAIVFRKIKMRMLADEMMRSSGLIFYRKYHQNAEFKSLVYDSLEYIAITKKSYHPTDYIYAKHLLKMFGIKPNTEHIISENYIEKLKTASEDVKKDIGKLLLIGFVIDGNIGSLEKRIIKKLQRDDIIEYDLPSIEFWTKEYARGRGFTKMIEM